MHPKHDVIQHSKPFIGKEEVDAAASVIASRQLAQGPMVERLEHEWCRLTKRQHAAAVGSGLGALRLALLSLGVSTGDEVIVPAYSCVALLNAVLAVGAQPVLADVERDCWTLDVADVKKRSHKRVKAVIAVHLFGGPCDIAELRKLDVPVIEDCAHALNEAGVDRPFGSLGMLNIGSFYATKLVAGGEGGIVASDHAGLVDRVVKARNYGDQEADALHLNDKMTDIEAAIVCAQLGKIDQILSLRQLRANRYSQLLADLTANGRIVLPQSSPRRVWYRYAVRLTGHLAPQITDWMARRQIHVDQPVWDLRSSKFWNDDTPISSLAFDRVISLPIYPDLTDAQQDIICNSLSECLDEVSA
jgi:perosamine synthetase